MVMFWLAVQIELCSGRPLQCVSNFAKSRSNSDRPSAARGTFTSGASGGGIACTRQAARGAKRQRFSVVRRGRVQHVASLA